MPPAKHVKAGTGKAAAADRNARFVEAYIVNGGNQTRAAEAAGYKAGKAAEKAGYRLIRDAVVRKHVERRRAALADKHELTTDRILKECARIAYADPRQCFGKDGHPIPIPDLDDDTAAAVAGFEHVEEFSGNGETRKLSGYTKKLKFWDKNAAIDKAMKHLGLYERDNAQQVPVLPPVLRIISTPAGRR